MTGAVRWPWMLALAALLLAGSLALFWPGVALYDSVSQYEQLLSGVYEDWHPPAMVRLWSLFGRDPGQAPMLVLQMALYWGGLGLLAAALARNDARIAGIAVLAIGAFPLFLGWQGCVLKDAQMAGAMLAAVGIAAWWRLADWPLPRWAGACILALLAYATLVRANAAFGTVPLAFALLGVGERWRWPLRAGAAVLAIGAVLVLSSPVNHDLLDARRSGVERTLPIFDLAGIAARAGPDAAPVLPASQWQRMTALHCYKPFFWDPLGDETRCGFVQQELARRAPGGRLTAAWLGAVARHPIAYGEHRLAHWNSTLRWWVPAHWPLAGPPAGSEPNDHGLGSPGHPAEAFDALADDLTQGPLGIPALWLVAAAGAVAASWRRQLPRQRLAGALAASAICYEGAFLLVGIASDLRYHVIAMILTALAWALLCGTGVGRRVRLATLLALLAAGSVALAARLALAPAVDSYQAALG